MRSYNISFGDKYFLKNVVLVEEYFVVAVVFFSMTQIYYVCILFYMYN
jgi:hypothetical protein